MPVRPVQINEINTRGHHDHCMSEEEEEEVPEMMVTAIGTTALYHLLGVVG
jgi:hypothetical protein